MHPTSQVLRRKVICYMVTQIDQIQAGLEKSNQSNPAFLKVFIVAITKSSIHSTHHLRLPSPPLISIPLHPAQSTPADLSGTRQTEAEIIYF